ncbi:MAG: DinB family protein [Trueperaceae bacterium]
MSRQELSRGFTADSFRTVLKSQYHASLEMLREAIELCPDDTWYGREHLNAFWQVAYHTLYFTHLYLQESEEAFRPWEQHQSEVQHEDGISGPPDPDSPLPLMPEPYSREQVLEYWRHCDQMVDRAVDALDLNSPTSGFHWYRLSKLEHQIINVRHVQHHAAQLADRLRAAAGIGIDWVAAKSGENAA